MRAIGKWCLGLAGTALATAGAYLWLDRPIALTAYGYHAYQGTFAKLTYIPEPLVPLACTTFVAAGLWALAGRPVPAWATVTFLSSVSVLVTEITKSQLKYVFGRTWPETFVQNNPSFIRDGAYGFNFFKGGPAYASFPSGHTAAICALVSVLWITVPRGRPAYVLAVLAVVIGLIGADYHFLSDMIAGGFVGTSIGWMTVALWRARP
jgi:membrane-associated phospholipid phosphatase